MAIRVEEKLALHGGAAVRTKPWPAWPEWDEREAEAVAAVARSGRWFCHGGTTVAEFTQRFAEYHNARFAVPCTNGTQAIELALRAAGVRAGDEVIVPPYTFIATASAVVQVNAIPVFVDIDP